MFVFSLGVTRDNHMRAEYRRITEKLHVSASFEWIHHSARQYLLSLNPPYKHLNISQSGVDDADGMLLR